MHHADFNTAWQFLQRAVWPSGRLAKPSSNGAAAVSAPAVLIAHHKQCFCDDMSRRDAPCRFYYSLAIFTGGPSGHAKQQKCRSCAVPGPASTTTSTGVWICMLGGVAQEFVSTEQRQSSRTVTET